MGFGTARAQREQEAEREAELLSQQIQQGFVPGSEAPKTISPKDAYVDYCEPEEEDAKGSLFPQDDAYSQDEVLMVEAIRALFTVMMTFNLITVLASRPRRALAAWPLAEGRAT